MALPHVRFLSGRSPAATLLTLVLLACGPGGGTPVLSEGGEVRLTWSSQPSPVPLNVPFELHLELTRAGRPLTGARVHARAGMPAHGHGMVREPRTLPAGEGRYRVEGMLFHMPGLWEVEVQVMAEGLDDRVVFPIVLE